MECDIETLKRKMLVKYPFFGSVITNVRYQESRSIRTAETDGELILYNPDFLSRLTMLERVFVLTHEVCHIAFNHIARSEGKNQRVWNIATDAVINQLLKRDGLKIVNGMIDMPEAINFDAETFYELLLKKKNKKNTDNSVHIMWKKGKEKHNNSPQKNNIDEKKAFIENAKMKKEQLEELREAIINAANNWGVNTSNNPRVVNSIGTSKPLLDWRYILRETTKYDVDYSYRNAIIEDGIIMARLEEIPIPQVEIVLDTSGSINEVLLKNFLRECKNILKHSKLRIGCFDVNFYGFHDISSEEDIENMKFAGGGGTDFNVAVNAFTRRVANKIIFTDGQAPMPNIALDVIWIVFANKEINPPGGRVIYINKEKLNEISFLEEDKIKRKTR